MTGRALRPRRGVPADAQILALTCFVVSCGLALWLTRGPALGAAGFSLTWLLLTALFGLAEATEVHVEVRRQTFSLSLSEIPLVIGLFLLGPGWLLAAWLLAAGMLFVVPTGARRCSTSDCCSSRRRSSFRSCHLPRVRSRFRPACGV